MSYRVSVSPGTTFLDWLARLVRERATSLAAGQTGAASYLETSGELIPLLA
jgi:hypothetical protein